tara:strand:+ start:560 stop:1192 length:633 start_codon:yes stop_codon:yes gene_type:complete
MHSKLFSSPIGKKMGMALTGLILYGFLIGHLLGNLLLLRGDGGQTFNAYSEYLINHPLLIPAELFLAIVFLLHIYLAISVTRDNHRARPTGYQTTRSAGGRNFASHTMIYSGAVILIFLVLHLKTFKYSEKTGTLYELVSSTFQQTGYTLWYLIAMIILGAHLWHAFQSALQTLSIRSEKIKFLGLVLCLVLAIGFGSLPLAVSWGFTPF